VRPARALIAGAGISGLAAGIALRQAGMDVEVLERSRELREVGAGLMLWPNGTRALQSLHVKVTALMVQRISFCNCRGRQLMEAPVESIAKRYGSDVAFVHRAALQAALVSAFGMDHLRLGSAVVGFEEDRAQVAVKLNDGTIRTGDLLVGADGLRSVVRRQLIGDGDPVYLGSTIWRGIVGADQIALPRALGINWVGPGSEFLAFHLTDGRIYWAGVTKEPAGERPGKGGHKVDLLQRFGSWAEPVPALITATDEAAILRNDMYDRPPTRQWSRGRVTLVGDAAHPMTPNSGQGACQALEDAVALGETVKRESDLSEALGLYERRRLRRANRVVTMSRQATRTVQIENPLLCSVRDTAARLLPRSLLFRMLDTTLAPQPAGAE
jgi:2-polyprenyl-6-methoxyphenol hydroxylase-like FAD-dependent oxidoreductase